MAEVGVEIQEIGTETPEFLEEFAKENPSIVKPNLVEEWQSKPYSEEDIKKYLTEKNLSSLSMKDYISLLKRFPSNMLTNVVWQGVRDHPGVEGRLPGKYSTGFQEIIADGKLRSPFGKFLKDDFKVEDVSRCLNLDNTQSKEDALEELNSYIMVGGGTWRTYSDFISVHLAAEEVADRYYGAETGNEIFIAFPAIYVAANYNFAGKFESGGGNHNDFWAWEKKGTGAINLNVGVVFIPAEARVDPVTGSKYQLDSQGRPIIDQDRINLIKSFVNSDKFDDFFTKVDEIDPKNKPTNETLKPLRDLLSQYGIVDSRLQDALLFPNFKGAVGLVNLESLKYKRDEINKKADNKIEENWPFDSNNTDIASGTLSGIDAEIQDFLMYNGLTYKEAGNTISSREYWENFFSKNPNLKPKHLVYYQGVNPTQALHDWRRENGLIKKTDHEIQDFGFTDNHILTDNDPRRNVGREKFYKVALEAIDNAFPA